MMTSKSTDKQQAYIALYYGKYGTAVVQTGAGFEILNKSIVLGYPRGVNLREAFGGLEKSLQKFTFREELIPEILEDTILYRIDNPAKHHSVDEI